ncbi:SAM hydrolase/SAM-dependent halogenase family protein [Salisaeta longa]|uniref:SAM hydrolase/SAM-dependent halogenase family protein n=1 Tax=Salisaeta longa TaxID=503170 RepID=UPI0003B55F0C|nr:SAM-dependent chlorinase/fluorinase [Salisaeta longa]
MITLTTDFGTRDAYVAAMKGVILGIHPQARLVDVTHKVDPQDVMEAAFTLRTACPYFGDGTVHLVVVDPGVGTRRKAVAVRYNDAYYVGPDNGVLPLVMDGEPDAIVSLDKPGVWRTETPSDTFHGRDIFAPVAAHLDAGRALTSVGTPIDALEPLRWAVPMSDAQSIEGWVVHVDRFGNCITNIRRETLAAAAPDAADGQPAVKCYVGNTILDQLHRTYGDVAANEPVLLFGSSGFLEVAVRGGSAAELLSISKGDTAKIVFQETLS